MVWRTGPGSVARVMQQVAQQGRPTGVAPVPADGPERIEQLFRNARRHSARVRLMKLGLPLLAVAMIAVFVVQSWLSSALPDNVSITGTAIESGRLVMSDPKLEGYTKEDRHYTMTASRAIQDIGSLDRVDLEGISARLPVDDDGWIEVSASSGTFDRTANVLAIDSEATLKTDTGVTAVFRSATVDIGAGNLETKDPVDITMDGTRVAADSLSVRERGAVLVFQDRVRVVIDAQRLQTASTSDGADNEN